VTVLVIIQRDAPLGWLASTNGEVLIRQAASLSALDREIRAQCRDDDVWYELHTGDAKLDHLLRTIRATRRAMHLTRVQVGVWTRTALSAPALAALPARDAAIALGVSYQRVQQIRQSAGIGGAPVPEERRRS
jgi:hypothetical protein